MTASPSPAIHIKVVDRRSLDEALNVAVAQLVQDGHGSDRGILITRNGPGKYAVELSSSVPYGLTYERFESA